MKRIYSLIFIFSVLIVRAQNDSESLKLDTINSNIHESKIQNEEVEILESKSEIIEYLTPLEYEVNVEILNVRISPKTNGELIGRLYKGDKILVYSEIRKWCKISKDEEKYVSKNLLKLSNKKNDIKDNTKDEVKKQFSFVSSFFGSFFLSLIVLIYFSFDSKKTDGRFSSGFKVTKGFDFGGPIMSILYCIGFALLYSFYQWTSS